MKPYYQDDYVTLYHGDCREVLPTLADESVGLVLTDPPYNVTETGARANTTPRTVKRADGSSRIIRQHFGEWDKGWSPEPLLTEANRLLGDGRGILAFTSDRLIGEYIAGPMRHKRVLVWRKTNPPPSFNRTYPVDVEWIVWKGKGDKGPLYLGDSSTSTVFTFPVVPPNPDRHPNEKPRQLLSVLVSLHSRADDVVLDPFMGSGSTIVAAKSLGRRAIGIEIEERYCEIAARRLSQGVLDFGGAA